MAARLAQPRTPERHVAHPELSSHQMIEWQTQRDEVSTALGRVHLHVVFPRERLDRFCFDEGDLPAGPSLAGKRSHAVGVTVPLEALARDSPNGADLHHGRSALWSDVNGDDFTLV